MYNGYDFMFDTPYGLVVLPITPPSMDIKIGSNNKVITLINEGDINVLKSPKLVEYSFEARFPMRQYPYARQYTEFQNYFDVFAKLKAEKKPFRFIVQRRTPDGRTRTWDTGGDNRLVALEEMTIQEDADNGDDVIIKFTLKQYKPYGVNVQSIITVNDNGVNQVPPATTSTSQKPRENIKQGATSKSYTIKSGDTLWSIAKKELGNSSYSELIFQLNSTILDNEAKKHGKESSSNGHWIYAGCVIQLPSVDTAKSASIPSASSSQKSDKYYSVKITTSGNQSYKTDSVIAIVHVFNGETTTIKNINGSTVTAMCDANSNVTVTISKPSGGHSFTITNVIGDWGGGVQTRSLRVNKNVSFNVNYVK